MVNKEENYKYKDNIKEIERDLVNFYVEIKKFRSKSDIQDHILAYLLYHEKLTQDQIRSLSMDYYIKPSRRGISIGSISSYLNELVKIKLVKRNELDEKKKVYEYSLPANTIKIVSWGEEFAKNMIFTLQEVVSAKYSELLSVANKNLKNNKYYLMLSERIEGVLEYFKAFSRIADIKIKRNTIYQETKFKKIETIEEVEIIEQEIINHLSTYLTLLFKNATFVQILCYFITRKQLTQKRLKKLTNLSSGQISKGLNYLLEQKLIKIRKIKGIREIFYIMESLGYSLLSRALRSYQTFPEWKPKIEGYLEELESNEKDLSSYNGYSHIKKRLEEFKYLLPYYEKLVERIKVEMEEYKIKLKKIENSQISPSYVKSNEIS